jgi:hypothetical protein
MNPSDVVDKTEAGQAEVRTRAAGLAQRLRTLLIMVDGARTVAQLQAAAAQVGAPADALDQLLQAGLVAVRSAAPARSSSAASRAAASAAPPPAPAPAAAAAPAPAAGLPDRLRVARQYINDTIVDAVGVRAVFFTLKVERCYSADDLEGLLPEFERLLSKARGASEAQLSVAHARELLH